MRSSFLFPICALIAFLGSTASKSENLNKKYGPGWDCGYVTMHTPLYHACKQCEDRKEDFFQTSGATGYCVPRAGAISPVPKKADSPRTWPLKDCENRPARPTQTAKEREAIATLSPILVCRADDTNKIGLRTACNQFVGQGLEVLFGNTDLRTGKGAFDFPRANEIADRLATGHKGWRLIGEATDQRVLDEAQRLANLGKPVVAAKKEAGAVGHVALVIPGTTQQYTFEHKRLRYKLDKDGQYGRDKEGNAVATTRTLQFDWGGLFAPNAAALALDNPDLMFIGCPLSAAGWVKPDGVKLYYKP